MPLSSTYTRFSSAIRSRFVNYSFLFSSLFSAYVNVFFTAATEELTLFIYPLKTDASFRRKFPYVPVGMLSRSFPQS
jgi:hypothetical protein